MYINPTCKLNSIGKTIVVVDSIPLKNQARPIVVVSESNLSNFSANVIHDMQVLGFLNASSTAQQTMNFLSNSWANMTQNASKGFKVGTFNR
jgi:hypothetical protein